MSGKLRVLYVLPSLLIGGAERVVSQWAGLLQEAGHTVAVCTLYTAGPFTSRLQTQGVCVHNLNHDPGIERYQLRRKYDPRLVLGLKRVIREGGYQIVHAHLFPALIHLAFVSYLEPRPAYLYSEHSIQNRRRQHKAIKVMDRFLYSRYRQILAVSEGVRTALCEWLPELSRKVEVVPNTVDGAEFEASPEGVARLREELGIDLREQVVLYAGRLIPEKGADILLAAAARLAGPGLPPVRLLLAGEGPLRPELEARGQRLPRAVRTSFLGNRADIPLLLGLADLVVLPSRWEGLPMILLEAMAAGKAILAAEVGGIPEAIRHGVNGWLAPPEDPAALAEGLDCLLSGETLRAKLGEKARETYETRYSPQFALARLLQVYSRYG